MSGVKSARQSVSMVAKAAYVPVYTLADVLVGLGFGGGYVSSYAAQSRLAVHIAVKILKGTKPQEIPLSGATTVYKYLADITKYVGFGVRSMEERLQLIRGSLIFNRLPYKER